MKNLNPTIHEYITTHKKDIFFCCSILFLIVSIKILFFYFLYKSGFVAISADEYSRTIKAFYWLKNPRLIYEGIWLPFAYYVEGICLFFWNNLFLVPKISVLLASIIAMIALYFLALSLFKRQDIALLTLSLTLFHPEIIWYSYLPFVSMYYVASILCALTFFILWLRYRKDSFLILTSISFFISSGFRYEAWFFILPYSLYLGLIAIKNFKENRKKSLFYLLLAFIPWLFAISWILMSIIKKGHLLHAYKVREEYLNKSVFKKHGSFFSLFMFFPKIFLTPNFRAITILIILSLVIFFIYNALKRELLSEKSRLILFPIGVTMFALFVLCSYTGFSSPPMITTRIILVYFIALTPLAAWLLTSLLDSKYLPKWLGLLSCILLIFLCGLSLNQIYKTSNILLTNNYLFKFLYSTALIIIIFILIQREAIITKILHLLIPIFIVITIVSQIQTTYKYPTNSLVNETHLGFDLKDRIKNHPLKKGEKVLLQLNYWGYRGVVVGSSSPDLFVFDGPFNPLEAFGKNMSATKKGHKSIFMNSPQNIVKYIRYYNIRYVVLKGTLFAEKLRKAIQTREISRRGDWFLFLIS